MVETRPAASQAALMMVHAETGLVPSLLRKFFSALRRFVSTDVQRPPQSPAASDWDRHTHQDQELVKGLGLTSSTMLVMGSMIGSGIFIVSADVARQTDSPALLIAAWAATGFMTIVAALSYGELAAMMPRGG